MTKNELRTTAYPARSHPKVEKLTGVGNSCGHWNVGVKRWQDWQQQQWGFANLQNGDIGILLESQGYLPCWTSAAVKDVSWAGVKKSRPS